MTETTTPLQRDAAGGGWKLSHPNPVDLVMIIGFVAFLIEVLEPMLFRLLPPLPDMVEGLVDAALMVAILTPLMFVLVVRRMTGQIEARESAEKELRRLNSELENQVEERTRELLDANRQLSRLVAEQRETADSLQRTNRFVSSVFENAACLMIAFDATTHQSLFVNARVADLLGFDPDGVAVTAPDFLPKLIAEGDRKRFLSALHKASHDSGEPVARGTCAFLRANGQREKLAFGVTVLSRTPTGGAKELLLVAMPTTA